MPKRSTNLAYNIVIAVSAQIIIFSLVPKELVGRTIPIETNISVVSRNDSINSYWLPGSDNQTIPFSKAVDQFLIGLNGKIRVLDCEYDGAKLKNTTSIENGKINGSKSNWSYCNK